MPGKEGGSSTPTARPMGDAWGQPAPWIDYHGPVEGRDGRASPSSTTPASFRFPTYWHARNYGLLAANPFGLGEFTGGKRQGGLCPAGGRVVDASVWVLLHRGDHRQGKVAEAFAAYAAKGAR